MTVGSISFNNTTRMIEIEEDSSITLECKFDALPPPGPGGVVWYHNMIVILFGINNQISHNISKVASYRTGIPAFVSTLTIYNLTVDDSGLYQCSVENTVSFAEQSNAHNLTVIKCEI